MKDISKEKIFEIVGRATVDHGLVLIQQVEHPENLRTGIVHGVKDDGDSKKVILRAVGRTGGEFIVGSDFLRDGFAENNRGSWRFYQIPMTPTAAFVYSITTPERR